MSSTHIRPSTARTALALLAILALASGPGCKRKSTAEDAARTVTDTVIKTAALEEGTTCDSSVHEGSELDAVYTFDLECAVDYLQNAGCDFALDLDGDGTVLNSRTVEDMFNDPDGCVSGNACTGCTDSDSIATVEDCTTFAAFSYFTENGWSDMQAACPAADDGGEATGCAIEGVSFTADEMDCAFSYFASMTCDGCRDLFDSRICEDAIDDADTCQAGLTCTGCDDGDSRDDGVDCSEIAAYSYFGASAAARLLTQVQANPCDGECSPTCDGRECGDDGCGGVCGTCNEGVTCDDDGICVADGCTIEGVFFEGEQMDCATWFFENMSCDTCGEVFDSRICEDAINDADTCQAGDTCTGCTDDDTRADGVTCDEIAAYSYFGQSAAQALATFVQGDDSCGEPQIVVDGVALTEDEAAAILEVANGATLTQLDDAAGMDARAAVNIVGQRPFTTVYELGDVSYVGANAINQLKAYAELWVPEDQEPLAVTLATLAQEAVDNGENSPYYDQRVTVSRAIITSEPYDTGKGLLFYAADPAAGDEQVLKVYVTGGLGFDVSFASVFDDVALTGTYTLYYGSYEILLNDADADSIALNTSGLAYDNFEDVQAAWHSTQANPEGVVRVEADFGYTYMVPLPVFVDHPMWDGADPGAPGDDGNEQDYNWNAAAQDALDDWRAQQ